MADKIFRTCQLERQEMIPLTKIETGKRVRLQTIQAGHKLRSRLAHMGLYPGAEFEVVTKTPLIVAVNGSRLSLGHGMACKISVY